MRAILQLVSAPLNPIPTAEHFRSHPPCEHSEHTRKSTNCLERDLNPCPRLSSADVLTTTPPR